MNRDGTKSAHSLLGRRGGPLLACAILVLAGQAHRQQQQADPLPSRNDGPAKLAILDFVRGTTDQASPKFVPPWERIATFTPELLDEARKEGWTVISMNQDWNRVFAFEK